MYPPSPPPPPTHTHTHTHTKSFPQTTAGVAAGKKGKNLLTILLQSKGEGASREDGF